MATARNFDAVPSPIEGEALALLQDNLLPGFLSARRWYAAKDAGTPRVRIVDALPLPLGNGVAQLCLLQVEPPGREPQLYQLPLVLDREGRAEAGDPFVIAGPESTPWAGSLRDGYGDVAVVRALLDGIRGRQAGGGKGLGYGRTEAFAGLQDQLGGVVALRWMGAEQSNTSIRVGDAAILKGLRKLESGIHPELEMSRFLTEVARFPNTPPLLGWAERVGESGSTALCILQGLVPEAEDAWGHVTGRLTARIEAFDGRDRAVAEAAEMELFLLMRRLGRRTAEMHRALATPTDDSAFTPEPATPAMLRDWAEGVRRMARTTLARLREALPGIEGSMAPFVASLAEGEEAIMAQIDALTPEQAGLSAMRLHGDYHLGQVLVSRGDVQIVDFEGEPMRPLAERRAKHCILRDVAGMLRSVAYAAATARKAIPEDIGETRRGAREAWVAWWEGEASSAFVAGYREGIGDCPGFPADPAAAARLLKLFLLEKSLYEVGYELANRPDWVGIPLAGVLAILRADAGPEVADRMPDPMGEGVLPLDRLAERMGIEAEFVNAAGETVRTSAETKRTLLKAMGIDAPDEAAAGERLAELERAELSRPLPPVAVLRIDRPPFAVTVALPEGTGELSWTLAEEDGKARKGQIAFEELPLVSRTELDGRVVERRRLDLGTTPPLGYHRLSVEAGEVRGEMALIGAPGRCHLPVPLEMGERIWGLSAQLYTLHSGNDWGMGDFGDLAELADIAAGQGAAVIGLNPLHAMFLDDPDRASPYSPASRLFLNPLYIQVTSVPEMADCEEARNLIASDGFSQRIEEARGEAFVDYEAVLKLKLPILERLYRTFREEGAPERKSAFKSFRKRLGTALERFCAYQALREHFAHEGKPDWRSWPEPFRDPASDAVAGFVHDHADRVSFFAWLQWVADSQLGEAAERARAGGMGIGFYRDLAVGADSSGAETWAAPGVMLASVHVGAPPDLFNPAGQDWGLPPFHPHRLREEAYAGFIDLVRANMRHAGALRIDHAMALQHVYWIPEGSAPSEGAYVAYPMDDLLGILALESLRHNCLVVGEDLGTVPEGFRERMAEAGILSYRVVFFEYSEKDGFVGPEDYPYLALATVGSHDLATLRGWWEGHDIELKSEKGLYPAEDEVLKQRDRRAAERRDLLDALRAAELELPSGFTADSAYDRALGRAVHAFLARSNAGLAIVQLDDLTDERAQVNLPGTVDQYPNWRRKLSLTLEELAGAPEAVAITGLFAGSRSVQSNSDQPNSDHPNS
ncbi:4-alpha-glucanotransferase [Azospirillum sp. SYSU D00513]|uniref:4-alpha-glucanotransferase n=1 Tax=Azospirillum sp. SYSU D00513 TaxID=2812561 RepID=UPI001A961A3A|nr:4-alpha-glucanotransferase [Azospirillum sp. SYSU D00513]